MIKLTIQHNIHLTRDQRYAIHEGIELIITGISVPVWFKDDVTSEPAKEIFCKYYLKNSNKNNLPIQILKDGYEITIPYRTGNKLNISDEEWRRLNRDEPDKLNLMYDRLIGEVSSINLLDVKDGGSKNLSFRESNKTKKDNKLLNVMHFVNIKSIENL